MYFCFVLLVHTDSDAFRAEADLAAALSAGAVASAGEAAEEQRRALEDEIEEAGSRICELLAEQQKQAVHFGAQLDQLNAGAVCYCAL